MIYECEDIIMHWKASVIVPVYNVEKYIDCCVDSILNKVTRILSSYWWMTALPIIAAESAMSMGKKTTGSMSFIRKTQDCLRLEIAG